MSWQSYVDQNLLSTGKVSQAAILGLKGGVWANSAGFDISPAEQKAIVAAFSNLDEVQAFGLRVAGKKYFTLSANERTIQTKMGPDGVIVVRTTQAVLVALYLGPIQAPETVPIVEGLADYLTSVGY